MSKQMKDLKSKIKDVYIKINKKNHNNTNSSEMSILVGISQLMH